MSTPSTEGVEMPPEAVCGVCRMRLNPHMLVFEGQYTVQYQHPAKTEGGYDHFPQPLLDPAVEVISACDFCGGAPADWTYPCEDFDVCLTFEDGMPTTQLSAGAWQACSGCHEDIEGDRWSMILIRFAANGHSVADRVRRKETWGLLLRLHKTFARHRTGPAVRFGLL